jgi:hypothetical protein
LRWFRELKGFCEESEPCEDTEDLFSVNTRLFYLVSGFDNAVERRWIWRMSVVSGAGLRGDGLFFLEPELHLLVEVALEYRDFNGAICLLGLYS